LNQRIVEQLRERLAEVDLTASRIAESMGLAERTLHMALAAHGQTFAALLVRLRLRRADQLRESPSGKTNGVGRTRSIERLQGRRCLAIASRNRASVV
jgi:AraC-like DNA-binding protein